MRRFLKILAWITGIPLALLLIAIGLAYAFSDSIRQQVITEVNRHLSTDVSVGEIRFDVFREFPQASVSFHQVSLQESEAVNDSALARFDRISLTLNLWDVLRKKAKIKSLILEKGYLSLAENKKGTVNFQVLSPDTSSAPEGGGELSFKKVLLREVRISYRNPNLTLSSEVPALTCSGNFSEEVFSATLEGELLTGYASKEFSLSPRKIRLNSSLEVDRKKEELRFNKTFVGLEALAFELNGRWGLSHNEGKLSIQTEKTEIKQLLSLLPGETRNRLEEYESNGFIRLRGNILQKEKKPVSIHADFSIDNGKLFLREFGEGLNGITLKGRLDYAGNKQQLHLEKFQARLMDDVIKGVLRLDGFEDPFIDAFLLGEFNLQNLKRIADLGSYNESSGRTHIDLSLRAKLSELKDPKKYRSIFLDGKIKGSGLNFGSDSTEERLSEVNTFIELDQSLCRIHRLDATWKNQRVQVQGQAKNFLAYLFNDEELTLLGRLKMNKLSLKLPESGGENPADTSGFSLPRRIRLEAEVELGQLEVGKFSASEIRGRTVIHNNYLEVKRLAFNSCEGKVTLNGHWSIRPNGEQPIVVNARLEKVNIRRLFHEFNSFGQDNLTEKNLNGKLSGIVDAGFLLDHRNNFLSKSLYAFLDLKIEEGELNDYEPMMALSRFVHVDDLKNIRFSTLKNEIEIRDETIFIPAMEIRNNALNLKIEGKHQFDNFMDYSLEMELRDVLASRYRRQNTPDEFEEEEEEGIRAHIRMSGTPDKLTFRHDRKKARQSFKQEMKKEGKTVKEILKQEFGIGKKEDNGEKEDEVPNWEDDIPE